VKIDKDKESRASATTGYFEAGKVLFPEGAAWLTDLEDELASFPGGLHDDCVDAISQALNWLRDSGGRLGLIEYYKELKMRARSLVVGIKDRRERVVTPQPVAKFTAIPCACIHCGSTNLEACETGPSTRLHCLTCQKYTRGELFKYLCPKCGGDTMPLPGDQRRCIPCGNQFVSGVPEPETPKEDPNHVHKWRPIPCGYERCDDCAMQQWAGRGPQPATNGVSRADYAAGAGRLRR